MKNRKHLMIWIIIIIVGLSLLCFLVFNHNKEKNNSKSEFTSGVASAVIDSKNITYSAAYIVDGKDITISSGTYESTKANQAVFLVINGGSLTIDGTVKIKDTKNSTNKGNNDNYNFYGINSAVVVVGANSKANINGATITSNDNGSNAVFATASGSVNIKNSTISTTQNSSRGLDATFSGTIIADNVNINTKGGSSASLATDRGAGTISATNMTLSTKGAGSPLIYSTGDITLKNSKGTSNGSQLVVIEGKNKATVENSTLSSNGIGNRNDVDNCGVMIYQSMSGDASQGTGNFIVKNSSLTIDSDSSVYSSAPFFFITNTNANISMTNTDISYGSNILIHAQGTSEWGNNNSNGGTLNMTTDNQNLEGETVADAISNVTLQLNNNSKYSGATSGNVIIHTDGTSKNN